MNVYGTEQIHSVVLLGHEGAGKATVAEVLILLTDIAKRMGKVPDGNTISGYGKEEIKRQFSISTTLIPLEYEGENRPIKVNLLDTPGFFGFVGEVEKAIGVADAAIIVVNCKAGIEPSAERAWEMCEKYNLPRLISVTNMDDDHASYHELMVKLETKLGRKIAPFQLPIRENEKFVGFVNVVKMDGCHFTHLNGCEECEIPDYVQKSLTIARDALIEAVAETSEEYVERYFLGEEFIQKKVSTALRTHAIEGDIAPVAMGSGINCQGFKVLLQAIDGCLPLPDHFECISVNVPAGERFTAKYNDDVSLFARVFRTIVDPFIGKYSLMKICIDTLKDNTVMYNVNKDTEEKIGKLYILRGKDQIEMQELKVGDIEAVAKLTVIQTGDTIAVRAAPIVYHKPQTSTPYAYMAYKAVNKGEGDKVSMALVKIMEEDLTLKVVNDTENRQTLLYGTGNQQLDVIISKLRSRYKVDMTLSQPKFTFRETLRKKVKVQGKHKKQSGGHGQYGDVIMRFEPSGDLEIPYVFEEKVLGGSVPRNYFPAVEKGLQEYALKGPVTGYPAVGLKATLLDGSCHPVDFSEVASKIAAILTFKRGFVEANPVLLEPIASLKVTAPDKFTGGVMGDLSHRRRRMLGMNSNRNGKQITETDISMSEPFGYNTDLRSMTGDLDDYSYEFSHYKQAPGDAQKRRIEARATAKDGE